MLMFARSRGASDRKLRLFACACCRRVTAPGPRPGPRWRAIDAAERFADGLATRAELEALDRRRPGFGTKERRSAHPAYDALELDAGSGAAGAAMRAANFAVTEACAAARAAGAAGTRRFAFTWRLFLAERAAQADLVRDIFGPTLRRRSVARSLKLGTPGRLARVIYEERRFDHLPVLADALEDAGCTDVDLLAHLRSPGPHVRGCWAVDLLLGKE
jgi:hypothetical protein